MATVEFSFKGDTKDLDKALENVNRKIKSIENSKPDKPFDQAGKKAGGLSQIVDKLKNNLNSLTGGAGGGLGNLAGGMGKFGAVAAVAGVAVSVAVNHLRQMVATKFDTLQGNLTLAANSAKLLQERLSFGAQIADIERGWKTIGTDLDAITEQVKEQAEEQSRIAGEYDKQKNRLLEMTKVQGNLSQLTRQAKDRITGELEAQKKLVETLSQQQEQAGRTLIDLTKQKTTLEAMLPAAKTKAKADLEAAQAAQRRGELQAEVTRLEKEAADAKEAAEKAVKNSLLEQIKLRLTAYKAEMNLAGAKTRSLATQKRLNDALKTSADWQDKVAKAGGQGAAIERWGRGNANTPIHGQSQDRSKANESVVRKAEELAAQGEDAINAWLAKFDEKARKGIKASARDREVADLVRQPEEITSSALDKAKGDLASFDAEAAKATAENTSKAVSVLEKIHEDLSLR